jgi:hypothetical protein
MLQFVTMEPHTGVSCAMTRDARGAQHRGECRGPRGNGGGGSQHPAETWGGECGSFWSQRKLRNGRDHRRCAAQIRCTEPSDIPLAHRHCPPGQVRRLACVAHSASVRRPGRPTFGGEGHKPGFLVFSRNRPATPSRMNPSFRATHGVSRPGAPHASTTASRTHSSGPPIPTASSKRSIVGIK